MYTPPSENEVDAAYEDDEYEDEDYEYSLGGADQGEGEEGVQRARGAGLRRGRQRRDAPWTTQRRRRRRHGSTQHVTAAAGSPQDAANATAAAAAAAAGGNVCARQDLWVEFDEIGWSTWIISPAGYNAYQCAGECPYPLGPALGPTNHATVQSIVHALGLQADARPPCCTPEELEGLSLLYTNEQGDVVLKIYEDMVARSCGCH